MGKDELDGLQNEAEIKHFNAVLLEAQAMAVKAEHEAAGKKSKHKWHNTGNSDRTKRRHGLTGPEAAWSNWRYHRHQTLPPKMAAKLKAEHEKKYGTQANNVV